MTTEAIQNTRKYLKEHFYINQKIIALETEKKELRITAQGGGISYDGAQASSKGNSTENKLLRLADDEKRIDDEIAALKHKQDEIRAVINSLGNTDLEGVLLMRFISHKTEEQTAEALHYSTRTVAEKTKKGIEKICIKIHGNA